MTVLNYPRIESSTLETEPFVWARVDGALTADCARNLLASIPSGEFSRSASASASKQYSMWILPLRYRAGTSPSAAAALLQGQWRSLCDELTGPAYRAALERLTDLALQDCEIEISLWRYDGGCFLSPHTDKKEKILTHIFYLTPCWREDWGGHMLLLRSARIEDVAFALPPLAGTSVVLVRSDASWHAVEEVAPAAARARFSLQVVLSRRSSASSGGELKPASGAAGR